MKHTALPFFLALFVFAVPSSAQYIDTSLAVGTPDGSFAVSPAGAATYSIPIEMPSGMHGFQPQVSITYNSLSGNGFAGWGCALAGISSITRGVRDVWHDGVGNGISYTSDDAFFLDGRRLIRQGAAADSVTFCPEDNPYTTVVLHSASSPTDSWFSVESPDGTHADYGTSWNSRQTSMSKTHAWYVSRRSTQKDGLSNCIEYSYTTDSYIIYPASIEYGGPSGGHGRVTFTYESRPDEQRIPLVGNVGVMKKRLCVITTSTYYNFRWRTYRTYTLSYDGGQPDASTTGYSRLCSVSVKNPSGESMNPIVLQWNSLPEFSTHSENHSIHLQEPTHFYSFSDFSLMSADMNGDGLSDIIKHAFVGEIVNGHTEYRNFYFIHYTDRYAGTVTNNPAVICKFPPDIQAGGKWSYQKNSPLVGDMDGDGRADIILPYLYNSSGTSLAEIHYLLGKDVSNGEFTSCIDYSLRHSSETPLYALGDFNLDGCSDLAVLERGGNGNEYDLHLYGGCHDFPGAGASGYHTTLSLANPPKKLFSSDYNGDGLPDLLVLTSSYSMVFWNTGNGLSSSTFTSSSTCQSYGVCDCAIVREGDFNGDGIADFVTSSANSAVWYFHTGNGNGQFSQSLACSLDAYEQTNTSGDDDCFTCLVYDMDGDGKSDVFVSKAKYFGGNFNKTKSYWLASNGTVLIQLSSSTSCRRENSMPRYYTAGDFCGDGLAGLLHYGYNCYDATDANVDSGLHLFRNCSWTPGAGRVRSVTDGLGAVTQVGYRVLTDAAVYTRTLHAEDTPPLLMVRAPIPVVSSVMADNGEAGSMTEEYTYRDLLYHNQGRGLLGFTTAAVRNQNTGALTQATVSRDPVTLLPQEVVRTQTVGWTSASTTKTYQSHFHHNTKALYNTLLTTVSTDMDGNTTTTAYTNDSTRNNVPLAVTVQGFDGATVATAYSGYVRRGSQYLPQTVTEQRHHPDHNGSYTDATCYEYDTKGQKTREVAHAGTQKALATDYTYDGWNNLVTSTTTAPGIEDVVKEYEYDTTHRFVTKKTERGYLEERYSRDMWGNVLTKTDWTRWFHTMMTAYSYDGWGRLTGTIFPTGQSSVRTMAWGETPSMRYSVYEKTDGQPWSRTWYDKVGREVCVESEGPKGLALRQDFTYNDKGQLCRKTDIRGSVTVTGTMTYDERGRMLTDTDDLGRDVSYSYGVNSVTTTDHGRRHTKTYDSWGNVKRSSDPVAHVTYSYHSCGKPMSVATAGATVTMEYDEAGNRTLLDDPDAGTMTYTYDALGRVVTQTDGNGVQTTNTYNSYGQLVQTLTGATATTYTYGTSPSDMGLLTSMSHNGFTETFQYDPCARVTQDTRDYGAPGTRTVSYTYDSHGQTVSRTFPGQLQIDYEYDGNGFLERMSTGGSVLYELMDCQTPNPYYSLTREELGGSLTRYREYDRAGRVTYSATDGGGDYIAPQQYTYDEATGNMTARSFDGVTFERFTYDEVDRLTRAETDGGTYTFLFYDTNGNIDAKYGTGLKLGTYYYYSQRPHALTDIENPLGEVDLPSWSVDVTYNELGKAASIHDSSQYPATITYQYGPDHQRWRSSTHLYHGDYEERYVSSNVRRSFVYLDGGVLAVSNNGGAYSFYYIHTDHQGSVLAVTDAGGNHVFKATYDPWGRQTVEQNTIAFYRGYTGHEMVKQGGLINMNGRVYDPATGLFLSPDNYVQEPWNSQNFNRYSYCLNNPLKYTDPSGELAWFVPVVIGAAIGAYTGASIQSHNAAFWNWKSDAWKGAIAGGIIGAAIGFNVSSAIYAANASNITGLAVDYPVLTKAAGVTNSILQSGAMNIGINTIAGGGWDGAWKSGVVGLATGAWSVTGGFGMAKGFGTASKLGKLAGKLGYQMIGTTSMSIGNNWAKNQKLFSNLTLGIGPVNLTIGKGQRLLQWENNIGNIISNSFGLINTAFGGKAQFDGDNLTFVYKGGLRDKFFTTETEKDTAFGSYAIFGYEDMSNNTFTHEIHHLWQSRAMNNLFWPTYSALGLSAILSGGRFIDDYNYYEQIGWLHYWYR